jgi:hypothetical protein
MHASTAIVEAIAALERTAGLLALGGFDETGLNELGLGSVT